MSKKLVDFSRNGITIEKLKLLLPGFWGCNDLHGSFITNLQNAVKNDISAGNYNLKLDSCNCMDTSLIQSQRPQKLKKAALYKQSNRHITANSASIQSVTA